MPYSSMNTGSGLIHQYLGEAFPKLLQLYERLPEIMEVYDSIHNSIISNFNLQAQAYIYNTVGSSFVYSPFIVGTTTESSLTYSLTADRNSSGWSIDPATGVIEKTMTTADVGTTILTITVVDSSINQTRTSTVNIVTFKDVSSIQDPIEISLTGSQYIEVTQDTAWTDPGVTYNVAAETVASEGTVNVSTPGVYVINYTASAQGIVAKATRVVKVVSNIPLGPTRAKVELIGDNPMFINWSGYWSDPGVTSEDSVNVVTAGSVNTQVPGAYIIRYTATATSGDTVYIDRVVIVGEKYQSQIVVPNNVLVATPKNTAMGIALTDTGLNDDVLVEIVSPPVHGNITSTNSTTAIYVPSLGFQGNDSFTFRVSTPDGSASAIGTAYILVGLGTISSALSLLSEEDVASKILAVTPGDLTYSIGKTTVSNMAPTGFGIIEIDTALIVSDSSITATLTETTASYDVSWNTEFLGVIRFRVRFGDALQSYWTEVILDVSEESTTSAVNNPLDQVQTIPYIEVNGNATSTSINKVVSAIIGTDAKITEVLNDAGSVGTATTDYNQAITYAIPNGTEDIVESFMIRITDTPDENFTQLRTITAVFKAFNATAPTITMIADYNTEATYTVPTGATVTGVNSAANGTSSVTSNVIKYIPNTGYTGSDSFTYIMDDGTQGDVNIYVADYNGQFKINNYFQPCNYQTLISFDPFVNDDATNPLFMSNTLASNGTVSKSGTVFTYVPNASFVGSDSFTYTMQNSEKTSLNDTATVWIEVLPDGAAPVTSNAIAPSTAVSIDFTDATNIYAIGTPTQTITQTNAITLEANGTSANSYTIAHKIPIMDPPVGKFLELTFKRDSSNSNYYDQDHTDAGLEIGFIYATDITQIVNTSLSWGYGRVTNTVMVDVPPAPSTNVNGVLRAVTSDAWLSIGDVAIDVNDALLTGWDVNTLWKYRFEFTSANEYSLYIYMDGTLVKKTTVTNPVSFVPDTSVISGMSFQHFSYSNDGSKELLADIAITTGTL